jgi:hypothetical protein
VEIEEHQEEEVLLEAEEDLEDLRSSLSLINMKVFLLLRDQVLIYFVLKTLFQGNQYTMKKELVYKIKMDKKLNIEFGIHIDQRLLLLFWEELRIFILNQEQKFFI